MKEYYLKRPAGFNNRILVGLLKKKLTHLISEKGGRNRHILSAIVTQKILDIIFSVFVEELCEGRDIKLRKFGTFYIALTKGGKYVVPELAGRKITKQVDVKSKVKVKFRPAPHLKNAIKKREQEYVPATTHRSGIVQ